MNKGIDAAMERAARISDSTHQGHVVEKPESKFEADIQDILGLLMQAEGEYHQGHLPMVLALVKDVRRKLVAIVKADARLLALAPTAPHDCDGAINKRKFEAHDDLLEACKVARVAIASAGRTIPELDAAIAKVEGKEAE